MQTNRSGFTSEAVIGAAQTQSLGKKRGDTALGQTDVTGFAALLQALAVGQSLHTVAPIQTHLSSNSTVVREGHEVSSAEPRQLPSSQPWFGQTVQARSSTGNVHTQSKVQNQAQAQNQQHALANAQQQTRAQFKFLRFDTGSGLSATTQSETSLSKATQQGNLKKVTLLSEDRTTVARPPVNHTLAETRSSASGAVVRKGLAESGRSELPTTTEQVSMRLEQTQGVANTGNIKQTNHVRQIPDRGPATEFRTERHPVPESKGQLQQWMTGASFLSFQHNAAVPEHTAPSTTIALTDPNMHQQFAAAVARQIKAGEENISVKVHPEGMGDIVVTVGRRADGLQVHVEANSQQTVALLTQQTTQMTDAIRALGIDLSDVQVSYGQASLTQDHGSQQQRQQHAQATQWTGISVETSSQTSPLANDNSDWLSGTISLRV